MRIDSITSQPIWQTILQQKQNHQLGGGLRYSILKFIVQSVLTYKINH